MAEFRRLISYIYEYEGQVKGKNVGFVKLEARNGMCRLNVNVKKLYMGNSDMGVYLLTGRQEIFLGNIFLRNGCGEFRTIVQVADVQESGETMDECYGLTIHGKEEGWRVYTTIWEDAVAQAAQLALESVTSEETLEREVEKGALSPVIPDLPKEPVQTDKGMDKAFNPEGTAGETKLVSKPELEGKDPGNNPPEENKPKENIQPENRMRTWPRGTFSRPIRAHSLQRPMETGGGNPAKRSIPESEGEKSAQQSMPEPEGENLSNQASDGNTVLKNPNFETETGFIQEKPVLERNMAEENPELKKNLQAGSNRSFQTEKDIVFENVPKQEQAAEEKPSVIEDARRMDFVQKVLGQEPLSPKKVDPNAISIPDFEMGQLEMETQYPDISAEHIKRMHQEEQAVPAPVIRQHKEEPLIIGDPEALAKLDAEDAMEHQIPVWDFFSKTYPKIQAFDSEHGCQVLVIKPQDIGLLPREVWIYGNNSFLLHGYYNYRYLILARLENPNGAPRYLLGIPGHYYSNEKYMASMFGFPHFVLSKKQPTQDGRFGYWYTDIRMDDSMVMKSNAARKWKIEGM